MKARTLGECEGYWVRWPGFYLNPVPFALAIVVLQQCFQDDGELALP
ncbi:MAG: hypothetical protein WAV95_17620 [Azonexus sp.]